MSRNRCKSLANIHIMYLFCKRYVVLHIEICQSVLYSFID